jgi:hypothetical protein
VAGAANAAANEPATSVAVTGGAVTIGGWGFTQTGTNLVLARFDPITGAATGFGVQVYEGAAGDDQLHDVLVDVDGNVYAGGSAGGGFLVVKYASSGEEVWRDQGLFAGELGEARVASLAFDGSRVIAIGNESIFTGAVAIAGYNPDGTQAITPFTDGDTAGLVVRRGEVVGGEVAVAGNNFDQTQLFGALYGITSTQIIDAAVVPTILNPLDGCSVASIDDPGLVAYSGLIGQDFGATIADTMGGNLVEVDTVQRDFSGPNFDAARAVVVDVGDRTYIAGYKLA